MQNNNAASYILNASIVVKSARNKLMGLSNNDDLSQEELDAIRKACNILEGCSKRLDDVKIVKETTPND